MFEGRVGVECLNGGLKWSVFTSLSEVSIHFKVIHLHQILQRVESCNYKRCLHSVYPLNQHNDLTIAEGVNVVVIKW